VKTISLRKKVAAVAVASLGFGLLSVVPANAATITDAAASAVVQKAGTGDNGTGGIAGPANTVTATVTIKNGASAANTHGAFITVAGADSKVLSVTGGSITVSGNTVVYAATAGAGTDAPNTQDIVISTPSAGDVVVNVYDSTTQSGTVYSSTVNATLTIKVAAAAISGAPTAAKSKVNVLTAKPVAEAGSAADISQVDATSPTLSSSSGVAYIVTAPRDANDTVTAAADLQFTATGACVLNTVAANSTVGTERTKVLAVAASLRELDNEANGSEDVTVIEVAADGSGNGGPCSVLVEGRRDGTTTYSTLATKSVTIFGEAASYTATATFAAITNNGAATKDAFIVCAKDKLGNAAPSQTIYAFSGTTTLATASESSASTVSTALTLDVDGAGSGTAIDPTAYVAVTPVGCTGFDATGVALASGKVTFTFGNQPTLAASTITTTASIFVSSLAASSMALSFDKATYAPGEKVTVTLTAKDAAGNPVAVGPGTATLTAALVSTVNTNGVTLLGTANNMVDGTATAVFYAPFASGTMTVTGTVGAAGTYVAAVAAGQALTASAKVSAGTELSAITTSIASLNAKIVALNALIAKIMKRLNIR
jgi:hypothetical protein